MRKISYKRIKAIVCGFVRQKYLYHALKNKGAEEIFTTVYRGKGQRWGSVESVSGTGSELKQTAAVIKTLPLVFSAYHISSMLDIPCGDFHWMQNVDLAQVSYLGGDIVADMVQKNASLYGSGNRQFKKLNLLEDHMPKVDLVFCRDCLVHLSFADACRALRNICASGSQYLLTTTFTGRQRNRDIATGQWRPLNLELPPFALPRPMTVYNEACTEAAGRYADKSLGLWRIEELESFL